MSNIYAEGYEDAKEKYKKRIKKLEADNNQLRGEQDYCFTCGALKIKEKMK